MVKPAKKKFIDGALSLKLIALICLMLQVFVSFSYTLIFIILESRIWQLMMLIFLAETCWALVTLAGYFQRTVAIVKPIMFVVNDFVLLVFWVFQK